MRVVHPDVALRGTRTSTGVPGLDPLLEGGFPASRAILLRGGVGTGKTTFGLHFLAAGIEQGEKGAFVSVDEKPRHLLDDAAAVGLDLRPAAAEAKIVVLDASPYFTSTRARGWSRSGIDSRQVASDLVQQVRQIGARRLVVDSLTSLVPAEMDRGQAHDYLRSLMQTFEDNLGCTVLLTCRTARLDPQAIGEAAAYLATGLVELRVVRRDGRLTRMLCVRKMRGTALDLVEHELGLEPGSGLAVKKRMALPDERSLFTQRPQSAAGGALQPSDHPVTV